MTRGHFKGRRSEDPSLIVTTALWDIHSGEPSSGVVTRTLPLYPLSGRPSSAAKPYVLLFMAALRPAAQAMRAAASRSP